MCQKKVLFCVRRVLRLNYLTFSTDNIAKVDWLFYNLTTNEVQVQLSLIVSIFSLLLKYCVHFNFSNN